MTMVATVDIERQVESLPTEKSLGEFITRCLTDIVDATKKLALAVAKAQREGWSLPQSLQQRPHLVHWLMKIANRQVDAKLYECLSFNTRVLRPFSGLPIQDQRRIAEEGAVEMATPSGDKRRVELLDLELRDMKQLFADDGTMRSIGAQKHYLDTIAIEPRPAQVDEDVVKIEIDKRSQSLSIRVGGKVVKIPKKDLARYLEQLI